MNNIVIAGTQSTPAISADGTTGVLTMQGDSYPENSFELYSPVIAWIDEYLTSSDRPLTLELTLLYLNTSSIKVMMDMFDRLEEAYRAGRVVAVNWLYDPRNERVAQLALEFKEDCTFPFVIARQE
jgi:hypothetical protein